MPAERETLANATKLADDLLASAKSKPLIGQKEAAQSARFTVKKILNPLVAAATPFLDILIPYQKPLRQKGQSLSRGQALFKRLIHEIKAFENHACQHNYRTQTIFIARYLLATLADNLLANTPSLLHYYYQESIKDQQLSLLIAESIQYAVTESDLIELAYLCLMMSNEQEEEAQAEGNKTLLQLKNRLYQVIKKNRGGLTKQFSASEILPQQKKERATPFPWMKWLAVMAIFSISMLLMNYYYALKKASQPTIQQLITITQQAAPFPTSGK